MKHYTAFIADLHLSDTTTKATEIFLKFLKEIPEEIDALYILGDLFKFWIGDDNHSDFNKQIKEALKKAGSKTPIYLMPGNRDFLLGNDFAKESGCILIPDPYIINLYGTKTTLTHGDLLCTHDTKYQFFRNVIRSTFVLKIFLKSPLPIRLWLAKNIQKYSAKIKATRNKNLLSIQTKDAKNLLIKNNTTQIIHGHIHCEETEEIVIDNKKTRRISLGDWDNQGSILTYYTDNEFTFKYVY